jgi:hypothetical protein
MTTLARGGRDLMYRSKPLFFLYSTDRSVYEHGFLSLIGVDADRLLSVEIGQRSLLTGQSRLVDRLGIEENKTETVQCKSRVISNLVGG